MSAYSEQLLRGHMVYDIAKSHLRQVEASALVFQTFLCDEQGGPGSLWVFVANIKGKDHRILGIGIGKRLKLAECQKGEHRQELRKHHVAVVETVTEIVDA